MNVNENLGSNSEGDLDANFETILVAVDFSEVSKQVYEVAANLAQQLRAKVVVLNVSEPQLDYVGLLPAASDGYRYAGIEQQVAEQLDEARTFGGEYSGRSAEAKSWAHSARFARARGILSPSGGQCCRWCVA